MNGTDDGAAAAHSAQPAEFVAVSALLTGFDEAELTADGMAPAHWATLLGQIGGEHCARLLGALAAAGGDPGGTGDEVLGELARALCLLWYAGEWPELSPAARSALGPAAGDGPAGDPARAYAGGLLWRTFGGHAPGSRQPGQGSWARPPAGDLAGGRR
ncbi:hypothetical protein [Kitasatospora sp. NPDC057223]|uniref:hypothetical protein n=1 Tax=Kitasatospora sp. NPDC057223 TaxID=3346055 RepID=UPI0036333F74